MKKITLTKIDENTIQVVSDDSQTSESKFRLITDESKQMMVALADFFGYEPYETLQFDDGFGDEEEYENFDVFGDCK